MEELRDDQVKAALTQALSAISRAGQQTKTRLSRIPQLNNALSQAINSFEPAPAPSPFPTDTAGGP